jgi:hypothetical protein
VLGVYGEELANGARTAVFGNATLGLAEELAHRGARLVHVYDTDPARVAEANARSHDRSIFFATLPEGGDVGVRDGAFDFVLVPDLSLFANPAAIMTLVRRVVSPLGAALIASPNADAKAPLLRVGSAHKALGYYELYEAIAGHFASVRMIGQAPFVGYAVAELSVEDPEPTIDSSLAESEGKEPDWFLALASDRNLRLDPFALIELPVQVLATSVLGEANDNVLAPSGLESAAGGSGTFIINILEAEREAALESLRQQEQALQGERIRADRALQELSAAREEVGLLRERCRALDERASELDTRVGQEEARRSTVEARLEKVRHDPELANLRERLRGADERVRAAEVHARSSEERLRGLEERARISEERARASEERARGAGEERVRGSEERARGLEVSARSAEERVRAFEVSTRSAEERARALETSARGAEERARAFEVSTRSAEERARGLEVSARSAEERVRGFEERARAADERTRIAEERARALETLARSSAQEREGELAKLEAQLRERGREIQDLRAEVDRRDKLVRELVMTNFPTGASPSGALVAGGTEAGENGSTEVANGSGGGARHVAGETEIPGAGKAPALVADLSARLDRLASDAARREADLVGARWRIAQLERELTQQR